MDIALERQELRVEKAQLALQNEQLALQCMKLARHSTIEEQPAVLDDVPVRKSPTSSATSFDCLIAAVDAASPMRTTSTVSVLTGRRVSVYWPAMGETYEGKITKTCSNGAVFVQYDDGDAKWETEYSLQPLHRCTRTSGCPKVAGHRGRCLGSKMKKRSTEPAPPKVTLKLTSCSKTGRMVRPFRKLGDGDGWGTCADSTWSSV